MKTEKNACSQRALSQAAGYRAKRTWKIIDEAFEPFSQGATSNLGASFGSSELEEELSSLTLTRAIKSQEQLSASVRDEQQYLETGLDTIMTRTTRAFYSIFDQIKTTDTCSFLAMYIALVSLNIDTIKAVTSSTLVGVMGMLSREAPLGVEDRKYGYGAFTQRLWALIQSKINPESDNWREGRVTFVDEISEKKLVISNFGLKGQRLLDALVEFGDMLLDVNNTQTWTRVKIDNVAFNKLLYNYYVVHETRVGHQP